MEGPKVKPVLQVTVIGAGLAGLSAAIGIQRAGHQVLILDKAAALNEIGAGINISPNATNVFRHWGLLEELESICIKPSLAGMHSWSTGQDLSTTTLHPDFEAEFLAPYLVAHRADLQKFLLKQAKVLGVVVRLGHSVDKIDFSISTVTLDSGKIIQSDLIIGADGERSISRSLLELRHDFVRDSGFDVYRLTAARSTLLEHADLVSLIEPYSIRMWVGPGAHMILYPLGVHDRMNIVFTRQHESEQEIAMMPQNVELEKVHQDFDGWDERVHKIIDIASTCSKRTVLSTTECKQWTDKSGRFALLGDAAHAAFPYMAQGAAMGIEDAGALGTLLETIATKSQLPERVHMYESLRKPRALDIRSRSEAFKTTYTLPDGPEQLRRDYLLQEKPSDGFANFLSDPVLAPRTYGYNVIKEANAARELLAKDRVVL